MQWNYKEEYEEFYEFPQKTFADNIDEEGNLQDTDRHVVVIASSNITSVFMFNQRLANSFWQITAGWLDIELTKCIIINANVPTPIYN